MPIVVLDLLKYAFLALLYIFMARAIRAIYAELRPAKPQRAASTSRTAPKSQRKPKKAPRRLTVVEGGSEQGKTVDVDGEVLIGRSDRCQIVIDDQYASQVHARVFQKDESVMVEDMGSTNGTYLNRRKLTTPTEVQRGDRLKIGKTLLELRK